MARSVVSNHLSVGRSQGLELTFVSLRDIGTDPEAALDFANRTVDLRGIISNDSMTEDERKQLEEERARIEEQKTALEAKLRELVRIPGIG